MSDIKRIEVGPRMSGAVIHNGTIYLAGQVGSGTDVTAQTESALATVERLLKAAGSDKTRILYAQIWLSDMKYFAEMNAVWDAWVPEGATPARACGEAKLATPEYLVEVMVTAAL